jgi:hypothetical protein
MSPDDGEKKEVGIRGLVKRTVKINNSLVALTDCKKQVKTIYTLHVVLVLLRKSAIVSCNIS